MLAQGIYQIKNTANGKLYIGSASDFGARWGRHRHDLRKGQHCNQKLQRAWNKYGENVFEFNVMAYCAKEDLIKNEQVFLDVYQPVKFGYNANQNARSSLGRKNSPETRAKLSLALKGKSYHTEESKKKIAEGVSRALTGRKKKPFSQEWRDNLSKALKGKKRTQETKDKMRISRLKYTMPPETGRKISKALKGRKQTPEQIEKGRLSRIGKKHSADSIKKMSLAKTGKKRSPEHIRNYLISRYGIEYVLKKEGTWLDN